MKTCVHNFILHVFRSWDKVLHGNGNMTKYDHISSPVCSSNKYSSIRNMFKIRDAIWKQEGNGIHREFTIPSLWKIINRKCFDLGKRLSWVLTHYVLFFTCELGAFEDFTVNLLCKLPVNLTNIFIQYSGYTPPG